jgi:excisionase family DNA binding protein
MGACPRKCLPLWILGAYAPDVASMRQIGTLCNWLRIRLAVGTRWTTFPAVLNGAHGVPTACYKRTMTQTQTLQCISTREAAELLTVARSTIYRMIERGELRSVKVGGRTVILKSELAALLGVEMAS